MSARIDRPGTGPRANKVGCNTNYSARIDRPGTRRLKGGGLWCIMEGWIGGVKMHIKITAAMITAALAVMTLCSCAGANQPSSISSAVQSQVSEETKQESSKQPEYPDKLPENTERVSSAEIRYSSKDFGATVTFPADFNMICSEYTPKNGIYMQTSDGTATLMLQRIKDDTVKELDADALVEFFKSDKEIKSVKKDKNGDIICMTTKTDKEKNTAAVCEKIRIVKDGYIEAVVCYRESDSEKYADIADKIVFKQ